MDQTISIITMLATVVPVVIAFATYIRDTKRKAQQDTIEAYNALQNNVLSKINRLTPTEVCKCCKKTRSDEYKQITEYLISIESFCIGLDKNIYDFDVFYDLARDYFNDKKGSIRPTIEPMLEEKRKRNNQNYHQTLERIWQKMDDRKRVLERKNNDPSPYSHPRQNGK